MGEPTSRTAALAGRTLGEFVVRELISSGGFGTVYRAEQPALGREAVIKVLHAQLRGSEVVAQRFLREARLASLLDHPYAAHTYAFGAEPDGVLWIAMEYVRGTPLDRLLQVQGPIPLARFVPLLERICEVVHSAHEQGIVHRDIKPANVMVLSRAGRLLPKLLDLGIAKLAGTLPSRAPVDPPPPAPPPPPTTPAPGVRPLSDGDTMLAASTPAAARASGRSPADESVARLTIDGATMGSPPYMAPEQWRDAGAASPRTDIYALGILCYEALTGRRPFSGASHAEIAHAHARQPPPPLGADLPAALDAVLARALAKAPEDRHGDALELAAAFREASGLGTEPAPLPRLDDDVRAAALAAAPQPLSQAIASLDAARNAHQQRDAVWQLARVVTRLAGVVALAGHSHVGGDTGVTEPVVADALRRLRARGLPDTGWLEVARDVARPFLAMRDAHPVPELIDFLFGDGAAVLGELLALRASADEAGVGSDESVRELLARALTLVERLLGQVSFLSEYRLVVPGPRDAEVWRGASERRPLLALRGPPQAAGRPLLAQADGLPVLALWPFLQLRAPGPGAPEALFFFDGRGRRGARLVALPDGFELDDDELWEAFGGLLRAPDQPGAATDEERCPFPGLSPFSTADAGAFFGRERETEGFVNRLRVSPVLAVVGPSGAGKSSFVQAGVIPSLPDGWIAVTVRPGAAPIAALSARLEAIGIATGDLRGALTADAGALAERLRHAAAERGQTLVLVIDQLEELFTLCSERAERLLYTEAVARAARSADDPVRVVFTVRDDFLVQAEAMPALTARLGQALQFLTTPAESQLRRILVEPLRHAGYEFEDPTLPDEMVDEVAQARGALALLSFTASRLWELRDRRFHQITRKAYTSLGGVGGGLARHAEETLQAMPPEQQRLVREIFRRAVTAEGTRAVLSRAELEQVLGGTRHAAVIEKLVAARLLAVSEGEASEGDRVEITHEALLEAWPRLVQWRREDAEGVRLRDELRAAARQWDGRGRPAGLLWRGDALAELRIWRTRAGSPLTDLEDAFAAASAGEAERERRNRRRLVIGSFAALAAVVVVLFALNARATRQRARAEDAQARLLEAKRQTDESARDLADVVRTQYESQGRRLILADDPLPGLAYLARASELGVTGPAHDLLVASGLRATDGELFEVKHDSSVVRARFSRDGARLVTAGYDGAARVWSAVDGRALATLTHAGPVRRIDVSPDGTTIATGSADDTAALWDAATGRRLHELRGHRGGLQAVLFSPDGAGLVTVDGADSVQWWDAHSGARIAELRPAAAPAGNLLGTPAAFSPDGALLAAGDAAGLVRLWRARDRAPAGALAGGHGRVLSLAFSPDGAQLATTGEDGTTTLWRVADRRRARDLPHPGGAESATFGPDGRRVVTAGRDGTAIVWRTDTGAEERTLRGHAGGVLLALFRADGRQILTASDDATVQVWDADSGRRVARLLGHRSSVVDASFDPRGDRLVTASVDGTAIVWSARARGPITALRAHEGPVNWAELSHDGRSLVSAGVDGTVRIWDVARGEVRAVLRGHQGAVHTARFAPDDGLIATGGEDGTVRLWSAESGAEQRVLTGHANRAWSVSWSPDGGRVASASADGTVRSWTVADGRAALNVSFGQAQVLAVEHDPTGRTLLAAANDNKVRLLDAASGAVLRTFEDPNARLQVAYSHDGARVLSCTLMLDATIWRADSGQVVTQLVGHVSDVTSCQWSPDDSLIVTSSLDRKARIWDPASGDLLAVVEAEGQIWSAAFAPDGRTVALATDDGVLLWELPRFTEGPAELERLLRCRVPYQVVDRRLTPRPRQAEACTDRSP